MDNPKKIIVYIDEYFSFLITDLGFTKVSEEYDNQYFEVIFQSNDIRIKIQNYYREIYLYTASILDTENEAAVYNILDYQNQNMENKPKINYYHEIENLEEAYRMQIKFLSNEVKQNYLIIKDFYNSKQYKSNIKKLRDFVIKRSPETFKITDRRG